MATDERLGTAESYGSEVNEEELAKIMTHHVVRQALGTPEEVRNLQAKVDQLEEELHKAKQAVQQAVAVQNMSQEELGKLQQDLARAREEVTSQAEASQAFGKDLAQENAALQAKVAELEAELSRARAAAAASNAQMKAHVSSGENLAGESGEVESPMLEAAYKQISALNTQMAHLYTELTLARNSAGSSHPGSATAAPTQSLTESASVELHKQNQQIADLVSDIRHLSLDLEWHQQKLEETTQEKQQMMKELRETKAKLKENEFLLEDREQMIKHRDIDIKLLREQAAGTAASNSDDGINASFDANMLSALRSEAAAKDSALIVSHYELHKEKLMRDRLEQKNFKLMDRMQKLMMVVETMRKDNVTLERTLAQKERQFEDKESQYRTLTQKAKKLQAIQKSPSRNGFKGSQKMLDMEAAVLGGPKPIDTARGSSSGLSTPRRSVTPRGASPYLGSSKGNWSAR